MGVSPEHAREAARALTTPSFVFATPEETWSVSGARGHVEQPLSEYERWLPSAEAAARASATPIVGALPFAPDDPVQLAFADVVERSSRWEVAPEQRATPRSPLALPDPDHVGRVREAIAAIGRGELAKVVLARAAKVELSERPLVSRVLRALRARSPEGYTYAFRKRDGGTLIGASPELLVSVRGERLTSLPLAGSRPRSDDPEADSAQGAILLESEKDHLEHSFVVADIVARLRDLGAVVDADTSPSLIATPTLWHLGTRIRARLPRALSSLRIALTLHPTPAVCGTPRDAARDFILKHEPTPRGLYAGAIGYTLPNGDGDWAVTIRCAELHERSATLFAGGGIVAESDPLSELAETQIKMSTLAAVLLPPPNSQEQR